MSLRGLEACVRVLPCFVAVSLAGGCEAPEEADFSPGMDPEGAETPSVEPLGPPPPLSLSCARIDGEIRLTWKNPQRYESILVRRDFEVFDELAGDAEQYSTFDDPGEILFDISGFAGAGEGEGAHCVLERLAGAAPSPEEPKPPSEAEVRALEAAYVIKYGVEESAAIEGGFFFIDGRYVEPPFRVARRGLVVYVNDLPVSSRPPFVFPEPPPEEKEQPAPPPRRTGSRRSSRETGRRATTSILTGSTS